MVASFLPLLFFSALWASVGIAIPLMTPKGPNQSIIRCIFLLTGATCWLFWLCCYMAQMNPLIGPILKKNTAFIIFEKWGDKFEPVDDDVSVQE